MHRELLYRLHYAGPVVLLVHDFSQLENMYVYMPWPPVALDGKTHHTRRDTYTRSDVLLQFHYIQFSNNTNPEFLMPLLTLIV